MKQQNKWILALKSWNKKQGNWCVPRKNTPEYEEVMRIMEGKSKINARLSEKDVRRIQGFDEFERRVQRREKVIKNRQLRDRIRGEM